MQAIEFFSGEWAFLSNFAASKITFLGWEYPTAEHAYQASKTNDMNDKTMIANASTPGQAKKLGRSCSMRDEWEEIKDDVMLGILRIKFNDSWMKQHLIETDDAYLIEGNNWHDNYWGHCNCTRCIGITGRNQLGKTLMQVRTEILSRKG